MGISASSSVEEQSARSHHDSGRFIFRSGGRYDTVCDLPVALMLPVVGQVSADAA